MAMVDRISSLHPNRKVFLSHSGAQKGFVEQLCVDLERCDRPPFFDKRRDCLPIGEDFPRLIFEAIEQCEVGVVVLSEEFFTSKWPMLELVAMTNVQKRKPSFTIMPILLGLSLSQCHDVDNHMLWLSLWRNWAECDKRIDLTNWSNALQLFGPTNALQYNYELGEVKYREEIVEAICRLVPSGTRLIDTHIQGRSRLCKVIHERIKQSSVSLLYGVHVIGLYGFGGIGKTTLCKAMCNDVSEEFCGKVAHLELGSKSEEELLKEVLRRLMDMNLERLGAMNVDEYRYRLMQDMMNVKVFLAIDNVSSATRMQALTILRANYGHGSVVMVTARTLNELTSLGILTNECMEMPELEIEEARSVFLYHAVCVPSTYLNTKDDHDLVSSCVQRCFFKKGDGISYHYHPLALQTLGEQLSVIGYVPERWRLLLHEIDFLNPFGEPQHPVFSILRISFDALNSQDQLLFMDVALFGPYINQFCKWSIFEWFGMVHGIPVPSLIERLENLKRKSLLETFGDGFSRISMHDLWREFARLETKVGEFENRRWMFEWDEYNALEESHVTNGGRLVNMRRMFFLDKGFMKLEDLNFACFPSVTILKLSPPCPRLDFGRLDLRGLKHLKSLELEVYSDWGSKAMPLISLTGLDSLLKLTFLRWWRIPSGSPCFDEISHLTNLQVLDLMECGQVPDLSNLILLQVASFRYTYSDPFSVCFNSNHTNLKFLDLSSCLMLKSCPGLGELVALQELCLYSCSSLKEVPNLHKLIQLQKLNVEGCSSLRGLPGLGDLVNLLELCASFCSDLVELPDMCILKNLKKLDVKHSKLLKSLLGLNELVCLRSLDICGCVSLTQLPNMHKLTNLQHLELDQNMPLESFAGLSNLISLQSLIFDEVHDGLDLCKLTMLKSLDIFECLGRQFSSLARLMLSESAFVDNRKGVQVLPNLQRLSRLSELCLSYCQFKDISNLSHLTGLQILKIWSCNELEALPDLQKLTKLNELFVTSCKQLRDVRGIVGLRNLKRLRLSGDSCLHENFISSRFLDQQGSTACSQLHHLFFQGCPIQEFPDLANFPKLISLKVQDCVNLTKLTCTGPLSSTLRDLCIYGCTRLQALPDLTNSQMMISLNVAKSVLVMNAQLIQNMKARWPSISLITE